MTVDFYFRPGLTAKGQAFNPWRWLKI